MTRLTILSPGALALVQDAGRPGFAHLGVGSSGAMDRAAHALANRLVGNDLAAATIEILIGGFSARFDEATWFAVTGAWGELALSDGTDVAADVIPVEPHTATLAPAGSTLTIGAASAGLRYYLAVRGGIDVPPALSSRSRDTLAALGPAPLAEGSVVPIGGLVRGQIPAVDSVPVGPPSDDVTLGLRPGPREGWFAASSVDRLYHGSWTVSPRSDRTGVRLEGEALERTVTRELPSEGMVAGAIQVSPDGQPTILAVDHPVTGGYPVIAVVTDDSLDALAQVRPGQQLRFRLATGR